MCWYGRLSDVVGDVVDESFRAFAGSYMFDVHVGLDEEYDEVVVVCNARVKTMELNGRCLGVERGSFASGAIYSHATVLVGTGLVAAKVLPAGVGVLVPVIALYELVDKGGVLALELRGRDICDTGLRLDTWMETCRGFGEGRAGKGLVVRFGNNSSGSKQFGLDDAF